MYEIDFTGWVRSPENIESMKMFFPRWRQHWIRMKKMVEYRRKIYWYDIKGSLFNLRKGYFD